MTIYNLKIYVKKITLKENLLYLFSYNTLKISFNRKTPLPD